MSIWIIFAFMTAFAGLMALWPLARHHMQTENTGDLEVYRQQLAELDNELAIGRIGKAEAEAARVELSRRLIAAGEIKEAAITERPLNRKIAALVACVLIPLVGYVFYGLRGAPDYAGQPLASRLENATAAKDLPAMVAKVEAHLRTSPNDLKGWELVAPILARMGRIDDAIAARKTILRLAGASAERETDLGELYVIANDGTVSPEAMAAFDRAVALDDKYAKALFFKGLGLVQKGDKNGARALWQKVIDTSAADAPWLPFIKSQLAGLDAPAATATGPDSEAGRQLQQMAPADQQAAIRGMVDGLAQRLAADGTDAAGWQRLIRAYMVLGDKEKAQNSVNDARKALAARPDALTAINQLASELKIGQE